MSTNWKGMQVPADKNAKTVPAQHGVKPKYMAMGSWHADLSKKGNRRPK